MVLEEGKDATKRGSKTLVCQEKNKQTEKLAIELCNFCFNLKEIADELTHQQLYEELFTLTKQLKTAIEVRASLLFLVIIGGIKHLKDFIKGCDADQIIERDTFTECNEDNNSLKDEAHEDTKSALTGQTIPQKEQTRETDTKSGETKDVNRLGSYGKNSKLMIQLQRVEIQNIANELQKQLASLDQRHEKTFKRTLSLIFSHVGTEDSECLREISEDNSTVTEEVPGQVTKIEQNTDEGQQFPDESDESMRSPHECNSTYFLESALRWRLRALLHVCKDDRVVPVVKTLNLINDTYKCPEFEPLSEWKVCLWKFHEFLDYCIQKKEIQEEQQEIEGEKGFVLSEIDNTSSEGDKKRNATDSCKG